MSSHSREFDWEQQYDAAQAAGGDGGDDEAYVVVKDARNCFNRFGSFGQDDFFLSTP